MYVSKSFTILEWLKLRTDFFSFSSNASGCEDKRTHPIWHILVSLICTLIIAARAPGRILNPGFIVEDGAIFFEDAFNFPSTQAILTTYAGYYHIIPRLIAEVGTLLPLSTVPLFYSLSALAITGISVSWFYLPNFRWLVTNDTVRLAFVALLLLAPTTPAIMFISYVQWYIAFWCILVTFMQPPSSYWLQWSITGCYLLAIFTAPVLVILLPIWLLRLLHAPKNEQAWIFSIIALQLISTFMMLQYVTIGSSDTHSTFLLIIDLFRAFHYRVISFSTLGPSLSSHLLMSFGWASIYLFGMLTCALIGLLVFWKGGPSIYLSGLLFYLIAMSMLLYIPRAGIYSYPFANNIAPWCCPRYFMTASFALLLLIFVHADHWLQKTPSPLLASSFAVSYVIIAILYSISFKLPSWESDWPKYSTMLQYIRSEQWDRRLFHGRSVNSMPYQGSLSIGHLQTDNVAESEWITIPIQPDGWCMGLLLPPDLPYTIAHGAPELLAIHQQVQDDSLRIDLVWKGDTEVILGSDSHFTAYVHMIDAQQNRMGGHDVSLKQEIAPKCSDDIYASSHIIQFPQDLASGRYGLAVGIYHFESDQLVLDGSMVMKNALEIP